MVLGQAMVSNARRAVMVAGLAVVACATSRGQMAEDVLAYSMATEHFFVHYPKGQLGRAEAAARMAEECLEGVGELTGLKPTHKIHLYLADTHAQFEALVGGPESFSIQGRADTSRGAIVVRWTSGARMRSLLAHEVAHVLVGQAVEESGASVPVWLNEGLAEWAADEVTPGDQTRRPSARERIYGLSELESFFPRNPAEADLAYAESRSFVEFVQKETGDRGLRRLLEALRAEKSVRRAFTAAYGRRLSEFEGAWRPQFAAGVRRHVYIDPLTVVFVGMTALFVFVIVARARRARRERAEEKDEDELEEEPYWKAHDGWGGEER